jgi:hypothetical protein
MMLEVAMLAMAPPHELVAIDSSVYGYLEKIAMGSVGWTQLCCEIV